MPWRARSCVLPCSFPKTRVDTSAPPCNTRLPPCAFPSHARTRTQAAGWVWLHRLRLGLPATALLTQASEPLLLPLHSLAAALLPARHAEALVWLVLALVQVVLYVAVAAAAARQVVGSQPLAWEALTRAVQAFLGVGRCVRRCRTVRGVGV